jgi:hypothetical protein
LKKAIQSSLISLKMHLFYISAIFMLNVNVNAAPPHMMRGNFKSCLQGICHLISEVYFVDNDCFTNNSELGVYYYLNNRPHIAHLNGEYDILETNCTMSNEDATYNNDDIGLYNFINDRYDIVYLIILAAAKIVIGVLGYIVYRFRKRLAVRKENVKESEPRNLRASTDIHFETIQEHHNRLLTAPMSQVQASAPPSENTAPANFFGQNIPETRSSFLSSTTIRSQPELYPSFASTINNTGTGTKSCSCHATEQVCSNSTCSCVKNNRACNIYCHIPSKSTKKRVAVSFQCINKYNQS